MAETTVKDVGVIKGWMGVVGYNIGMVLLEHGIQDTEVWVLKR